MLPIRAARVASLYRFILFTPPGGRDSTVYLHPLLSNDYSFNCQVEWEVDDGSATNISDDHVKVHFRKEIDEDGRPPAGVESLWAVDLGDGTVRLDNTPWFVRGVANGDVIRIQPDDDGLLWAGETVAPSQNCTIRLIVLKDDGSAAAGHGRPPGRGRRPPSRRRRRELRRSQRPWRCRP
ncbi:DUF4265 domain-containing protein [Streptomyces sp. NPDC048514]|uniref:DUF4265 domain-containing protein n=1 Tax=Streptomyces sp. NPDC048514 TaxID=3365564 RepID=UPI003720988B